jgi:hypothetical protein
LFRLAFVCSLSFFYFKVRDPDSYRVESKLGFWRFFSDPHHREILLVVYGYDLYAGWQKGEDGYVVYTMIVGKDGLSTGFILITLARTRCPRPRVDGFVYSVEDKLQVLFLMHVSTYNVTHILMVLLRCYKIQHFNIYMADKWTCPAYHVNLEEIWKYILSFIIIYFG